MNPTIAQLTIEDIKERHVFSFQEIINQHSVNSFVECSGDNSTIHVDSEFAQKRGFQDRVVHGVFLASYFSRLIGVLYPGENSILQTLNLKFLAPAYINDFVKVAAEVDQISMSTKSIMLKLSIENVNTEESLVKGKALVGFTG